MKLTSLSGRVLAAAAVVSAASTSTGAQTLLTLDGENATVVEVSGPPNPSFCFYPKGPTKAQFSTTGGFPCALPGVVSPVPGLLGDITVHRDKDTVWVTDGVRVAEYDASGAPVQSFGLPAGVLFGPILGLGFEGAQGTLWATDGARALELLPPTVLCGQPTVVSGPVSLPALGPVPAAATDIEWDPATGTLWVCDAQGFVGNITRSGGLITSFQATPGACGLATPLTGIAVDSSSPTPGILFVTDGFTVASLDSTGGTAALTFGQPFGCTPLPATRVNGIGFSSRPITYGDGGGVLGPPEIGSIGQAVIPSTNLAVTLSGATPGAAAFLPFSLTPLCPEITVATVPILIFPQAFAIFATQVNAQGEAAIPIPIPATGSPGIEVFYQWFVMGGGPSPDGPPILSSGAGSMRTGFK